MFPLHLASIAHQHTAMLGNFSLGCLCTWSVPGNRSHPRDSVHLHLLTPIRSRSAILGKDKGERERVPIKLLQCNDEQCQFEYRRNGEIEWASNTSQMVCV